MGRYAFPYEPAQVQNIFSKWDSAARHGKQGIPPFATDFKKEFDRFYGDVLNTPYSLRCIGFSDGQIVDELRSVEAIVRNTLAAAERGAPAPNSLDISLAVYDINSCLVAVTSRLADETIVPHQRSA